MLTLTATLALPAGLTRGWLTFDEDRIVALGEGEAPSGPGVDLGDRVVCPGFIDVHVHGGDGGQVAGSDPRLVAQEVLRVARFHATHGTTRLVATTISDSTERLLATLAGVKLAMEATAHDQLSSHTGASIAGAHLEGPWLAPQRRGAHDPGALRHPDVVEFRRLLDASGGMVKLVTVAPELPGADELIGLAAAHGTVVSVGHTEATYEQAQRAFNHGASHLTHLGNAMRGIDRREPGPIAAALTSHSVTVEVIADGHHLHPGLLRLVAQAAPGRMVVITDAIAATGLPDGHYRLGEMAVLVDDDRATLEHEPETLAGSVLTMDKAVANLIRYGISATDAINAATLAPAHVLGEQDRRGALTAGHQADLVVLSDTWSTLATVVAGRTVYDPAQLLHP